MRRMSRIEPMTPREHLRLGDALGRGVRKARGDQRRAEVRLVRDADRLPVTRRLATADRGEAVAVDRVVHDPHGGLAVDLDGDRDSVARGARRGSWWSRRSGRRPSARRWSSRRSRPPRRGSRRRVARARIPSTIRRSHASSTSETMSVADDFVRTRERGSPRRSSESPAASAARSLASSSRGASSVTAAPAVDRPRATRAARLVWFSHRFGSSPSTRHTWSHVSRTGTPLPLRARSGAEHQHDAVALDPALGLDPEVIPATRELAPQRQHLRAPAVEVAVRDGRRRVPFDVLGQLVEGGLVFAPIEQLQAASDALQGIDRRSYVAIVAAWPPT